MANINHVLIKHGLKEMLTKYSSKIQILEIFFQFAARIKNSPTKQQSTDRQQKNSSKFKQNSIPRLSLDEVKLKAISVESNDNNKIINSNSNIDFKSIVNSNSNRHLIMSPNNAKSKFKIKLSSNSPI